jgi:putative ABC transport system permease protein
MRAVQEAEAAGASAAPFLFTVGQLQGEPVVVAAVDFSRAAALTGFWRVEGERRAAAGECLAGSEAAKHFHLAAGQALELDGVRCTLRGIVTTGGPEDAQILVPLGARDAVSLIQIRADPPRLPDLRERMKRKFPGVDVRLLYAVAETEANVVLKVKSVLFLLSVLILAVTTLCVTTNFSALLVERRKEIGVLKAIGAGERAIAALFFAESLVLALTSTASGYGAGLGAAYWIGRRIFPSAAGALPGVDLLSFFPVAATTLAVAALGTILPAARIWRLEAAEVLRGD